MDIDFFIGPVSILLECKSIPQVQVRSIVNVFIDYILLPSTSFHPHKVSSILVLLPELRAVAEIEYDYEKLLKEFIQLLHKAMKEISLPHLLHAAAVLKALYHLSHYSMNPHILGSPIIPALHVLADRLVPLSPSEICS